MKGVSVEFEPTMKSALLGCDAAMKMTRFIENLKGMRVLEWFGPLME